MSTGGQPAVFVSCVSPEFRTTRQRIANILTRLGYIPVFQEIFGTEGGDLRQVIREKIDGCEGLIQVVGRAYGAEPPEPDADFGRISYTQFEFFYARNKGKKTWLIFAGDGCTFDTPTERLDWPHDAGNPNPAGYQAERRALQAAYRTARQADGHLYHPASSDAELDLGVERLRDELRSLRQAFSRWQTKVLSFIALIIAILLLIGGGVWWTHRRQSQDLATINANVKTVQGETSSIKSDIQQQTGDIKREISGVKRETSDDPRKELANLGVQWDDQAFVDALMRGDERTVRLFLAGGMTATTNHNGASAVLYILQPDLPDPVPMLKLLVDSGYDPNVNLIDTRIMPHYGDSLPPHFQAPDLPPEYAAWKKTFAGPILLWVVIRGSYMGPTPADAHAIQFLREHGAKTELPREYLTAMKPVWGDTRSYQEVDRLMR
jgi:hypothetical protein